MFIFLTYAQAAGGGAPDGFLSGAGSLLPLVLIFVIFWFLILRPQQKRMKQHRAMVSAVKRNDTVVTAGGIIGKISRVHEEQGEITVEIAEGVKVRVIASTLTEVRAKGEPAKSE